MRKLSMVLALVFAVSLAGMPNNVNAQFSISPHASFGLPMSDMSDNSDYAIGGGVNGAYMFKDNVGAVLSVDYFNFHGKEVGGVELDNFGLIPVLAGIKYCFTGEKFKPYLSFQGGMYFNSEDNADDEIGLAPGAGFLYPIGDRNMMLDVAAKFNWINTENDPSMYFGLNVGLHFDIQR